MHWVSSIVTGWLILVVSVGSPTIVCQACCPAFGRDANVRIADQTLLIVWDPQTQTEHFVRRAAFESGKPTANFGFLVPSPSEPAVEEAEDEVFNRLASQSQPHFDYRTKWQLAPVVAALWPFMLSSSKEILTASQRGVDVIQRKQVAGYDVAVLKADDAQALTTWLDDNGYDGRAELQEWAQPYVEQGWFITAFKYAEIDNRRIGVNSVRMSFRTPRAVFPYRVPTDQIAPEGKGNLLRTYVVGPGRATGTLGNSTLGNSTLDNSSNGRPWSQAKLHYSRPISLGLEVMLEGAIPAADLETLNNCWLTTYEDRTWPSGTEDLWFDFDQQGQAYQEVKTVVERKQIFIPIDLIGLGVVGVIWWRRQRNTSHIK